MYREQKSQPWMFTFLTELYLTLPVAMWLYGWVQIYISLPVIAALVYALYRHYKSLRGEKGRISAFPTWGEWIVYFIISLIAVFLCGFDGRVPQGWDLIVRNPIYSCLVRSEWPLVMPDGRIVLYALMFWLPPALVSKWLPGAEIFLLQVWCFAGVMLMLLNLHGTLGARKVVLLTVAISVFTPLSGMVDDVLNVVFHHDAVMGVHFRLPSAGTQWTNTFHYFIVAGLYLTLVTERRLPLGVYMLVSALFACLHPILASVAFPLVVCQVIRMLGGWRNIGVVFRMPEIYLGVVTLLVSMLYYSSGGSCWWAFTLDAPFAPETAPWMKYALGMLLAILPPLLVWWSTRCKIMLFWAAWSPIIVTLWYGETNGVNEWMYKYTVLYSFYVVYYIVKYIHLVRVKWVGCFLMLCSLFSFMRMVENSGIIPCAMKGFPVNQANVMSGWNGSLYHPEDSLYYKLTAEHFSCTWLFR